ncbi:precorrin-2 C(20)-methyltransferase [Maridesulfovibrio hydrothermalis]|uniref:Precorrin-2 C20-methyltransferase n=1 Tax=Maridesulfovibrio hydrothermalis AM13 = DSM 14728 TaxID=1121451 RepID=L0RDC7_9BACT|nr:precorrin-2 C(20)-methyltransferase [Maridesulfovibrio hydrothermalis]CCO24205.1 Precorrin-2 C20-methyltransferase [Maridesulfovibrio hydrothermalis AM13 = DSM 14728]
MSKLGKIYGIGVGPGDSDLLTVRAVKILEKVDVVFAASSTKNDYSNSLAIASEYINETCEVVKLGYPMTRDKDILQQAWEDNCHTAVKYISQGKNAAFLTLGDPLIYSTFGYMMQTMNRIHPEVEFEVVPGITSYQAAAAKSKQVLVESGQNLLLTSGVADPEKFSQTLEAVDNAVILKAYRNFPELREIVGGMKKMNVKFYTRLGMDGEAIYLDINEVPEKTHYLSLMLLTAACGD